jgi:hypothetical protein
MKNIQGWAAAAVMVVLAGCTTEVTAGADGGPTSAASGGSAGAAGSTTTSSGAGGSATGGSGGSSSDDGGACVPESSAGICEKCAFDKCMTATCECKAIADCNTGMDGYFTCIAALEGGDMQHCAENFAGSAGPGAGKADTLAQCMETNCLDRCQGRDAGPRR